LMHTNMLSSALAVSALLTPVWSQYFENGSEFCDSDHDDDTLPACGCQNRWQLLHVLTDQKIAEKPAVELGEADGILAVVNCISECCKRDSCYAFLYTEQEKRGVKTFTCGLFDEKEGVPGITEAEGRTIQQDVGKKYVKYEYTQKLPSDTPRRGTVAKRLARRSACSTCERTCTRTRSLRMGVS